MAILIIHKSNNSVEEIVLEPGTVNIGRNKDNDIRLNDSAVSAYHAKIVSFFKPTYIQDLRSTNGTYVNGKRVMEHTLQQGDEIMIGKHRIIFDKEGSMPASSGPESTMELSASELNALIEKELSKKS